MFISALEKIICQGYKALQLEYYFTCGPDEVKAWTVQKGTKAPQAAGRIHTDFEKGFVMAEVMKFSDFKEEGSEAACKVSACGVEYEVCARRGQLESSTAGGQYDECPQCQYDECPQFPI